MPRIERKLPSREIGIVVAFVCGTNEGGDSASTEEFSSVAVIGADFCTTRDQAEHQFGAAIAAHMCTWLASPLPPPIRA
jgi:hypothetical protein